MTKEMIEGKLAAAKNEFLKHDLDLLRSDVNERSMTHKFAEYLQRQFPNWNVDCEYNRKGKIPKYLNFWPNGISSDHLDARTVYPDIIVHRRGRNENLLVIEAKKSGNDMGVDCEKLKAFRKDFGYQYRFTALLEFDTHKLRIEYELEASVEGSVR